MTKTNHRQAAILQKTMAWAVHVFTASGAAWGILAIIAIQERQWKEAAWWMAAAIFVDGADGFLARKAKVRDFLPDIDGALLDNILDYLNYVIVPGLLLYQAELLPAKLALVGIMVIAITSSFQFTRVDAKTEDHYFTGFPSYWNVTAIYMLVLGLHPWINLGIVLFLSVMVFVPVKYVYPSRTAFLRRLTLVLTLLWAGVGMVILYQYPDVAPWVVWSSLIYVGYYVGVSLLAGNRRTV